MKINADTRKQLSNLPALIALNSGGNKTQAEYTRLWHQLLDEATACGVHIMAVVNPHLKVNNQQTLHHPLIVMEGLNEVEVENSVFVQSRYWPSPDVDRVEFVGYFS